MGVRGHSVRGWVGERSLSHRGLLGTCAGLGPAGLGQLPADHYLPGGSEMGLAFGNLVSFFGNFLSRYTHIPVTGGCGGEADFPKKAKTPQRKRGEVGSRPPRRQAGA